MNTEENLDWSSLNTEELIELTHHDIYDGLAKEVGEETSILLERAGKGGSRTRYLAVSKKAA